jgi:aconitate hydratase
MYLGVRAIIAKSIERIHNANLINFGIVPFVFADAAAYDGIDAEDELVFEKLSESIAADGVVTVRNVTKGTSFTVKASLTERQKAILAAGGLMRFIAGGNA